MNSIELLESLIAKASDGNQGEVDNSNSNLDIKRLYEAAKANNVIAVAGNSGLTTRTAAVVIEEIQGELDKIPARDCESVECDHGPSSLTLCRQCGCVVCEDCEVSDSERDEESVCCKDCDVGAKDV